MIKNKVTALVGAQYGSEGKGAIARLLSDSHDIHVRTGGPNAGHTFWHEGKAYVMQSLPCGWTNLSAKLVIGAGAVVDLAQLSKEVKMVSEVDPDISMRIYIDTNASIISDAHFREENGVDGELHARIGSTGKGVGACRIAILKRQPDLLAKACDVESRIWEKLGLGGITMSDTVHLLNRGYDTGSRILLEGTQGSGLSVVHGPWPYVTTGDTNAGQLATDAGLAPSCVDRTILVARTMPIRVAGNSGPMNNETHWEDLSARIGRVVTERTTVTKKTRRVSEWDDKLFARAVLLNRPKEIALTFVDYLGDGSDQFVNKFESLSRVARDFVSRIEDSHNVYVRWLTTGPTAADSIDRGMVS